MITSANLRRHITAFDTDQRENRPDHQDHERITDLCRTTRQETLCLAGDEQYQNVEKIANRNCHPACVSSQIKLPYKKNF